MSDSARNSEDGISAGISTGDVGKPAGNNIESNRSRIQAPSEVVAEGRIKANNASRTSGPSESSMNKKESKAKAVSYTQEDCDALEKHRHIPLLRVTGRQQEELHDVFYRKYAERKTKYMNRWELLIHAHFPEEGKIANPSMEPPTRSTTPGPVENSFAGGFIPIHQPQQRGSEVRHSVEPIRYGVDESYAQNKYVPTTEDVLDMYNQVKRNREKVLTDETLSGSSRASPRPETLSPSLGKRNRGESPIRGHIITSIAASDFTPMDEKITPEMATNFERQDGRLPTGITVSKCVVDYVFTSLDTHLRTDREQVFIAKGDLDNWRNIVTLVLFQR